MGPGGPTKLDQMVTAGKLGKKSGEGFYVWKDGKVEKTEPEHPYDRFELERLGRELVSTVGERARVVTVNVKGDGENAVLDSGGRAIDAAGTGTASDYSSTFTVGTPAKP